MVVRGYGVWKAKPVHLIYNGSAGGSFLPHLTLFFTDGEAGEVKQAAINIRLGNHPGSGLVYWRVPSFTYPITDQLAALGDGFQPLAGTSEQRPGGIALDFLRGNLFPLKSGTILPYDVDNIHNDILDEVEPMLKRAISEGATVYIYGSRFSDGEGIHDIHMNQGSTQPWTGDNGLFQDGAIILQFSNHWEALFIAFASQAVDGSTDDPRGSIHGTWADLLSPEIAREDSARDDLTEPWAQEGTAVFTTTAAESSARGLHQSPGGMYPVDILNRRFEAFVLWVPEREPAFTKPPELVLGCVDPGGPRSFRKLFQRPLSESRDLLDLWELDPRADLTEGVVYHYWFEIEDSSPEHRGTICATDPLAFTVDDGVRADGGEGQPASVVKYRDGKLWPCNTDGVEAVYPQAPDEAMVPDNNRLVIYEISQSCAFLRGVYARAQVDVLTFDNIRALFDSSMMGRRIESWGSGEGVLAALGINAVVLDPCATPGPPRESRPAAANFFTPNGHLGTASALSSLIGFLNTRGIRFLTGFNMATGSDSYRHIDFQQFHIRPEEETSNPDSYKSGNPNAFRGACGGDLWRYIQETATYDPEHGYMGRIRPSWAFHHVHLGRWMSDFIPSGICVDRVEEVGNWDFIRSYKERAWQLYHKRHRGNGDPAKFLVAGKGRSPDSMVHQGIVDAVWNDAWQVRLRAVILGEAAFGDNFEQTARKLVDCRLDQSDGSPGFTDGAQVINYITSYEMGAGAGLYDFLVASKVEDIWRRSKVAFSLLLTSVGIPMTLAGEEFANSTGPVYYGGMVHSSWEEELFKYIANLVKFRTGCPALGQNDTHFLHVDQNRGGRIMAWQRGGNRHAQAPVVIVANLSDEDTPDDEYVVPDWPQKEMPGWIEVTQNREVPPEWVAREPLRHWEVKVYSRWRGNQIAPRHLHRAVRDNDIILIRQLIEKGANVDERGDGGETAFSLAMALGRMQVAQELIKAGADTSAPWDTGGSTETLLRQLEADWALFSNDRSRAILLGIVGARTQDTHTQPTQPPQMGYPAQVPSESFLQSQWEVPVVLRSIDCNLTAGLTFLESWRKVRDVLGRVVTLTGSQRLFECSPCKAFLEKTWHDDGLIALNTLSVAATWLLVCPSEAPCAHLEKVDDEEEWCRVRPLPLVHVTGDRFLVAMTGLSLQQQASVTDAINWICCSIRPTPERS